VTLTCHPEAKPKDLANEKEILRFAQNDSFAVTLAPCSPAGKTLGTFLITICNHCFERDGCEQKIIKKIKVVQGNCTDRRR
jgi:acetyltransferase-like isoleucine patch superfamily enzyme